eukprot:SAG11_NODE_15517_length_575_cov_1.512605_1_plen_122_part_10
MPLYEQIGSVDAANIIEEPRLRLGTDMRTCVMCPKPAAPRQPSPRKRAPKSGEGLRDEGLRDEQPVAQPFNDVLVEETESQNLLDAAVPTVGSRQANSSSTVKRTTPRELRKHTHQNELAED